MTALVIRTILCLLIVTTSAQKDKPLDTVIDELSSIARVTNGIAIEAGMVADKRKMEEVVAEFMGLRSADVIGKMKQMKVTDVVGKLAELKPLVEKVAKLTVNTSDIQKSFEALEEMKKNAHVLGKQVTDPGGDLKSEIETVADQVDFANYEDRKAFKEVAKHLEFIKQNADVTTVSDVTEQMKNLMTNAGTTRSQLLAFANFHNHLMLVWNLQNTSERLSNVSKFAVLSEQFTTNFPTLSSMATILRDLKNGISNLKAVAEQQKSMPDVVTSLEDMSAVAVEVSNASPSVRLTAGLAGGVGDLKLMFEDLKGDRMRKMIAGGKETTELAEKMADVSDLHAKLEGLDGTWKQFDRQKYVGALKKVPLLLSDAMNSSQFVPDMDKTVTSLGSLQKCFTDIKMPPQPLDYKQVREILDYGRNLSTQITKYKEFMTSRNKTLEDNTIKLVNSLVALLKPMKTEDDAVKIWKNIVGNHETDQLITSLSTLHKDFQQFDTENPFRTIDKMEKVDWTVFSLLLNSLDNTNLLTMINCLGSVSYQSKDILSVINFRESVDAMKSEGKSFTETNEFLSQMSKVQQGLMQVEGAGKQSKRSRRRRDVGAKSVGSLKNAEEVSVDLGRGVQVLRQLSRILDKEKSVMRAIYADDVIMKAIDAIRGSQSVWSGENRDSLKEVVDDVRRLEHDVKQMNRDTMSALWLVFDAARQVPQVQIDAKVFGDPIATGLSAIADPTMQTAAGDFKVLATLDLDFVKHHIHLKAAFLTHDNLRQFFDDFFDLPPDVGALQTSEDNSNSDESFFLIITTVTTNLVTVLCVLAIEAAIYLLLIYSKHRKQQKFYEMRKEIWACEWSYPDNNYAPYALHNVIRRNNESKLKEFLEKGAYLDYYYDGYTPLQWAVKLGYPKVVEMLIRGGADRSLRSIDRTTAKEMAKKMHGLGEDMYTIEARRKVKKLFEKYENKTFKCRVREPLPVRHYAIDYYNDDDHPEFQKRFYTYCFTPKDDTLASHFIVPTDKDKVFDCDLNIKGLNNVFHASILVDQSWAKACLEDESNLERAYDYRVRKIRFNGKVYETVDELKKITMHHIVPVLEHVELAFLSPEERDDERDVFNMLGYVLCGRRYYELDYFFKDCETRHSPPPYWFPSKKKQWIVFPDGKKDEALKMLNEFLEKYPKSKGVKFEYMSFTELVELCVSLEAFGGKMPVVKALKQ